MKTATRHAHLEAVTEAALAATDPFKAVQEYLPSPGKGRILVLGLGKAAARMGEAVEKSGLYGQVEGLVIVPDGYERSLKRIELMTAAHPVPDERSLAAGKILLKKAGTLGAGDVLLFLVSGGGSALAALPVGDLTLQDKQRATDILLKSGAGISEINAVRQRASRIKGGALARAAHPAHVVNLIVSDVPGDDPALVASGPGVAPLAVDTEAIIKRRIAPVDRGLAKKLLACPPTRDEKIDAESHVILRPADMLGAAEAELKRQGCRVISLGDRVEGEARDLAKAHAALFRAEKAAGSPLAILSGGEATVTVKGSGAGGPNQEYALALSLALEGEDFAVLALDTDGKDGIGEAAGARIDGQTAARIREKGLDPAGCLDANDSRAALQAAGALIRTGPTCTNVNDLRIILG